MSEWDQREVCPDGACTGVIGADGTCKVCGRAAPNWGDERRRGLVEPSDSDAEDDSEDDEDDYDDSDSDEHEHEHEHAQPSEWGDRELCSDGACVGVLDDNGVCRVCGKKSPTWRPRVPAVSRTEDAALRAAAADLAASIPAEAVETIAPAPSPARDDGDDDEPRALCPDGACVGVIGTDGKCKLCGTEAA